MNNSPGLFRIPAVLLLCAVFLIAGCSDRNAREDQSLKLDRPVYGFYLGERLEDARERGRYRAKWESIPNPRYDYRGELFRVSRALDGSRDVDYVRLAFLDGYLMEVIVYFRDTGAPHLRNLKNEMENRYGKRFKSPDGTIETAFKTYRFSTGGMSVTLRRITKKPADELFIQYLHDELNRRLLERKRPGSGG